MTIEEALKMLERYGITRSFYDPTHLVLCHETFSEQIGEIYTGPGQKAIYLAEYMPSQLDMTYNQVQKSLTLLDSPRAHIRLETILSGLPASAQRYEDSLRDEKIKNVQQYFREKKRGSQRPEDILYSL